ncbi:hypothetical protein [Terrabacter sp. 2RAF25]|uniref:hypothetical protein n=1 Tax=Terrabacter sp. 2RAF25 TaxID=3232998 RepID=UPI003F95920B
MNVFSGSRKGLMAKGLILLLAVPAAAVVTAPSSYAYCTDVGNVYYTTSQSPTYRGDYNTRTYGKSGGTLTISLGESVTTGGSITGTTSAEAGVIFAKASVSVGVTIKKDWTSSVTRAYAWKVPSTQSTGWIEAGHHAYKVTYTKKTVVPPCTLHTDKTGTIVGNTSAIEFTHS